jgi:hypothetical protein
LLPKSDVIELSLSMLKLTFHRTAAAVPAASLELTDFRVSGGTLGNPLEHGLIATYSDGSWQHRGQRYPILAVTGGGCLLFGVTREPTTVSDPIDHYYFIGPTLSANGVAIAKYIAQQDMWHGIVRPMWWTAMRILSVPTVSAVVEESQVLLLNPWEPHPIQRGPATPLWDERPQRSDPSTNRRLGRH